MKDDSRIPPDSSLPFFPPFSPSPEFGIQFSTKTDETTAETAARGHFETANYEQRFVNHYSTFNYGGWMPGMGDIATLVATHAALSIQY